jgi:hypothetical protein
MNKKTLFYAKLFIIFIILFSTSEIYSFSLANFAENYNINENNEKRIFSVHLNNGDVISCTIIACILNSNDIADIMDDKSYNKDAPAFEPFIIANYFDDEIIIYENEIMKIQPKIIDANHYK